jgi:hypothetical protein
MTPSRICIFVTALLSAFFSGGCSRQSDVRSEAAPATPATLEGFAALKWTVQAKPPANELASFLRQNAAALSQKDVFQAILAIAQSGQRELAEALIDDAYLKSRGATQKGAEGIRHRIATWYRDGFWPLQNDDAVTRWRAELERLSQIGYVDDK